MATPQKVVLLACGSFNPPTNMHLRMFELGRDFLQRSGKYSVISGIMSPVSDGYNKKMSIMNNMNPYQMDLAPAKHRCSMLRQALKSTKWVQLDTWECEQPTWLETEKVLTHHRVKLENQSNATVKATPCKKRRKDKLNEGDRSSDMGSPRHASSNKDNTDNIQLKLLCGGDLLESFAVPGLWKDEDIEAIVSKYGLVCITRNGSDPRKFIYESDILTKYQDNIHIVTEWIQNEISSTKIRRALKRNESVKYLIQDSVIEYIRDHQLYGCTRDNKYSDKITPSPTQYDIMDFVDGPPPPNDVILNTLDIIPKAPVKLHDGPTEADPEAPPSPRINDMIGSRSPKHLRICNSPKRLVEMEQDEEFSRSGSGSPKSPQPGPCMTDLGSIVRRVRNMKKQVMESDLLHTAMNMADLLDLTPQAMPIVQQPLRPQQVYNSPQQQLVYGPPQTQPVELPQQKPKNIQLLEAILIEMRTLNKNLSHQPLQQLAVNMVPQELNVPLRFNITGEDMDKLSKTYSDSVFNPKATSTNTSSRQPYKKSGQGSHTKQLKDIKAKK